MTCWRCSGSFADPTGCRTCGAPVDAATASVATAGQALPAGGVAPPHIPGWSTTYTPGAVPVATQPHSRVAVRPPGAIASWLLGVLAVGVAADALAVVSGVRYRGVIGGLLDGSVVTQQVLDAEAFYGNVGMLQLLTYVPCVVLFLVWFARVDTAARLVGAVGFRHGHGWAVGSWFVPILNLFRPKQMVDDAWRATDPALPAGGSVDASPAVPRWVGAWWTTWVLGNLASWRAMRLDGDTLEGLQLSVTVGIAADVLLVAAGVLAIVLVRSLTARVQLRAGAQGRLAR